MSTKRIIKEAMRLTSKDVLKPKVVRDGIVKPIKKEMSLYSKIEQAIMQGSFDHLTAGTTTRRIMKLLEDQETKETWNDICEEFNIKVADKEKFFVTATQFFNYLKKNYHSPKRKLKQ